MLYCSAILKYREGLEYIINTKEELKNMPIIANVDLGHTYPLLTIPLGGTAIIDNDKLVLEK